MQLISEEYRSLNTDLHSNPAYGVSSVRHVGMVCSIAQKFETQDILDYGCGKSMLARNIPFNIQEYDPAIKEHAEEPKPADIVVCTDVLEHIEPELLDNVLKHLKKLTKKAGFFTVATRPAKKILADGRNAHLIVQPAAWWEEKLKKLFNIVKFVTDDEKKECLVFVEPLNV